MDKTRYCIYTDGSCLKNPGPGGWAYVYTDGKNITKKSGNEKETTNNRMELTAVLTALKDIPSIGNKKDEFFIFSDSAYVVDAIKQNWVYNWIFNGWVTKQGNEVKNRDLWEEIVETLRALSKNGCKPVFIKVKGHSGDYFNSMVDDLAVKESKKAKESL